MTADQNGRLRWTHQVAASACVVALLILTAALGEFTWDDAIAQSSEIRTELSPDVPIHFENPEGAPLIIRDAKVKVISRSEYLHLVGSTPDQEGGSFNEYVSFPIVTVTNNTNQRVTGFALFLRNKQEQRMHFVKLSWINIEPHSDYAVEIIKWVPLGKRFVVGAGGELIEMAVVDGAKQQKIWMPGGASDLEVAVRRVELEDGSRFGVGPDNSFRRLALEDGGDGCVCNCGADCSTGKCTQCAGDCDGGGCWWLECELCMDQCCAHACLIECMLSQ
jgi:hypothetical protein